MHLPDVPGMYEYIQTTTNGDIAGDRGRSESHKLLREMLAFIALLPLAALPSASPTIKYTTTNWYSRQRACLQANAAVVSREGLGSLAAWPNTTWYMAINNRF